MRRRWQAKLHEVKLELRRRLHFSIPEQGAYLGAVVRGHFRYYGVPGNSQGLDAFRTSICRLWWRALNRRSQRRGAPWERMRRLIPRWIPPARICHPYPDLRFATTRGRSRMR
jgi:RNA-directed DNA polymerase